MKNSTLWRIAQFVGNCLLTYWILQFTANLWVIVPIVLISVWNFIDGKIRSDHGFGWQAILFVGNCLLTYWILQFTANLWVIVPIVLISVWNFIDGMIRK